MAGDESIQRGSSSEVLGQLDNGLFPRADRSAPSEFVEERTGEHDLPSRPVRVLDHLYSECLYSVENLGRGTPESGGAQFGDRTNGVGAAPADHITARIRRQIGIRAACAVKESVELEQRFPQFAFCELSTRHVLMLRSTFAVPGEVSEKGHGGGRHRDIRLHWEI